MLQAGAPALVYDARAGGDNVAKNGGELSEQVGDDLGWGGGHVVGGVRVAFRTGKRATSFRNQHGRLLPRLVFLRQLGTQTMQNVDSAKIWIADCGMRCFYLSAFVRGRPP